MEATTNRPATNFSNTLFAETGLIVDEAANLGVEIDADTWLGLVEQAADELGVTLDFVYHSSPEASHQQACSEAADEDQQVELFNLVTEAAAGRVKRATDELLPLLREIGHCP